MKKSKIILKLLQENYELKAASEDMVDQFRKQKNGLESVCLNLTNQISLLTAKNRQLIEVPRYVVTNITTDPDGKVFPDFFDNTTGEFISPLLNDDTNEIEYVDRQVKNDRSTRVPRGKVIVQRSGPRTGKTQRANAWVLNDPKNRRIVDGDWTAARQYANEGYDVVLNLLPGQ